MDEGYRKAIHVALNHRPTVIGTAMLLVVAAALIYPLITVELMPQTDEGEVNINAELAVGTRVERTEEVLLRLEDMVRERVPEVHDHHQRAAAAATGTAAGGARGAAPIAARSA